MSVMDWLKVAAVLGPIAVLFLIGFWLIVRSGLMGLPDGQGLRRMVENASRAAFLLVGCLVALAFVQRIVGFHLALAW
jgi:hypothetical protein